MKWITSIIAALLMISAMATEPVSITGEKGPEGIEFHTGTWEEALVLAKKEGKPIFLDISASWCGPCKLLKSNTFPNAEVGDYYNENFINVAVDGEKGEGITLASKYKITGYPTLLYLDSEGIIISQKTGYHDPAGFIELGKQFANK